MLLDRPIDTGISEVRPAARRAVRVARYAPGICALIALALHLGANAHYGFFRDELYFIICGRHPDFGYVDQPPITPLLAAFSQTWGLSLFALRAIPAVFAALGTYVTALLVVELGGGLFAIVVACSVVIVSPQLMAFGSRFSPDTIQMATWPLIALIVLRITKGASPRLWILAGVLLAFSAYAKYTVAFFAASLVAAMWLTQQRRALQSAWFVCGALLSVALLIPNIVWQWHYHFPMLQLLHNDYGKFLLTWPPFPFQQIMVMSPLLSIVWLIGLGWLLYQPRTRFLGIAYVFLIAIMWALNAKSYYPAAVYPILIAAGAVPIERWTGLRRAWRIAIVAVIAAFAIPSTPFVLPVLPLQTFIAYQQVAGSLFHIRFHTENDASNAIPIQYYAEMTGWQAMTRSVAQVYRSLPPAQRAHAAIYAHNFGEAAAIDLYGGAYGLPPALSGNNNYWIWGPRGFSGETVVDLNGPELMSSGVYRSVHRAAVYASPDAMPYENNLPIWVLTNPSVPRPLQQLWPSLRNYSYAFKGL
ncbi:MAG TPA: glycosyltransferase family 39 protein [Candidatus Baltobacteraceae bacterium]|nr:glycosyltransferase family 39 protein [Candidatus Baltobacteraceae bacterium]